MSSKLIKNHSAEKGYSVKSEKNQVPQNLQDSLFITLLLLLILKEVFVLIVEKASMLCTCLETKNTFCQFIPPKKLLLKFSDVGRHRVLFIWLSACSDTAIHL